MTLAVEMDEVTCRFRTRRGVWRRRTQETVALSELSLDVEKGQLFGLLGPNGAGKTTTVKVLTSMLIPTSGNVRVLGKSLEGMPFELRRNIGFVLGGDRGLYWRLTGRENLRYFARLYGLGKESDRRVDELLARVGLAERADERVQSYSRGMKQRLHIARSLIHDPELIFLDEPTTGLDPVSARDIRKLIRELVDLDKTVFLTTHYLFEVELLCEDIAIIDGGRLVTRGSPASIKEASGGVHVIEIEVFGASDGDLDEMRALPGVQSASIETLDARQKLLVQSPEGAALIPQVMACLGDLETGTVNVRQPSLEDAYVRLVSGT